MIENKEILLEDIDGKVLYEALSDNKKNRIINVLLKYYRKNCWFGEGIMQDDNSLIEAPDVLAKIADDIFKFESEYI